jgi:hypothetical protein
MSQGRESIKNFYKKQIYYRNLVKDLKFDISELKIRTFHIRYTVHDAWNYIKRDIDLSECSYQGQPITFKVYKRVMGRFANIIEKEVLINPYGFLLPKGMGILRILRIKPDKTTTKQARKNYYEFDGTYFIFAWLFRKRFTYIPYRDFFTFIAKDSIRRALPNYIKEKGGSKYFRFENFHRLLEDPIIKRKKHARSYIKEDFNFEIEKLDKSS